MKTKFRHAKSAAALLCAPLLLLASVAGQADEHAAALERIAAGDHRSAANKARDAYRNPVENLLWFGLRPDMTVVEITPGGGWYTEILAPFLKDKGRYYAAGFDADSEVSFFRDAARRFQAKLEAAPELYGAVVPTVLAPPARTEIAPPGSADLVLTFRNVHNWMDAGTADAIFAAMFQALKPGGVLGVVEHRGDPARPQDPRARSGYVTEEYVIGLANKAGFELAGRAEINANPKDGKDHPQGVWMLPPTLSGGEQDRERYLAIGESDRMTLKFIKPPR
jgi:predicted methyltransferase